MPVRHYAGRLFAILNNILFSMRCCFSSIGNSSSAGRSEGEGESVPQRGRLSPAERLYSYSLGYQTDHEFFSVHTLFM